MVVDCDTPVMATTLADGEGVCVQVGRECVYRWGGSVCK